MLKSTDAGKTWNVADTGLTNPASPTDSEELRVDAFALDPRSPNVLYAGTGIGVFKTTDGARTWRLASTGIDFGGDGLAHRMYEGFIWAIAIDPVHTSTVYAAGRGLWKRQTAALPGSTCSGSLPQPGNRPASAQDRLRERVKLSIPRPSRLDLQVRRQWRQLACDWADQPRRQLLRPPDRRRSPIAGDDLRGWIEGSLRKREPGSHVEEVAVTRSGSNRTRSVARERALRGDVGARRLQKRRRRSDMVGPASRRAYRHLHRDRTHATTNDLRRRPVEIGTAEVDGGMFASTDGGASWQRLF